MGIFSRYHGQISINFECSGTLSWYFQERGKLNGTMGPETEWKIVPRQTMRKLTQDELIR